MSSGSRPERHEVPFRPRARLVSVLGEHLISDQAVGLIELVKNAYDADATEVKVRLLGLASPETTTVIVSDNGSGMTPDDIETKWLSPAVDHKERDKRDTRRTSLGRLPIGEKGVGRFAVHQIGRRLELVSRAAGSPEVVVPVDWDRFDNGDVYLDSMAVSIEHRDPVIFTGSTTGTEIRIEHARAPWTRQLLEKVHRTLRRLQSPLRDRETRFTVTLECPEFPEYENIDPTDILERAHYEFQALVDEDGQCDFEYHCRHPALPARTKSGSENLVPMAGKELPGRAPSCGPFWINLYVWDRAKDYLARSGISTRELNAQSGVSLFRDGLRVLPYGEPGDDWLLLDQERIQDPSGRISNNQVIGLVQVLQEKSLQLRDKTNREGLIENEAFHDLRAMTRAAIRLFTSCWKKDRPRDEPRAQKREGSLELARDVAAALKQTASDDVRVEIPPASLQNTNGDPGAARTGDPGPGPATVTQREAVEILIENLDGAMVSAREREERFDRIVTLAATGLAAERVVHEFGRQVVAALGALAELRRAPRADDTAARAIDVLGTCLGTLRSEFRILAPYEVVGRAQRSTRTSVRDAAELALTINRRPLDDGKVEASIEGEDFEVTGRPASIVQVLDNLVHNACHWLSTQPAGCSRRLTIVLDHVHRRMIVADTGPGVHAEAAAHLFQPFFTMKADGTGLGLYISAEIARRMGAMVRLGTQADAVPAWATGAVFIVDFGGTAGAPRHEGLPDG